MADNYTKCFYFSAARRMKTIGDAMNVEGNKLDVMNAALKTKEVYF